MPYLKANWPNILLSLLGTAFAFGFAWALVGDRVASAERRLDEIETAHVAETHWQVQENTGTIAAIQSDARQTESEIARIDTRLGVIDAKLDAIAETLKKK